MKKLVIMGTGTTVYDFDYNDPNYEIWLTGSCCGESANVQDIKRADKIFEIHQPHIINEQVTCKNVNYKKFGVSETMCQDANNPIMQNYLENPVTFPLQKVIDFVGGKEFFCCSMDYMIVYAAMLGYKEIKLHKVLLWWGEEYFFERPSVMFWIEYCHNKFGVKFDITDDSAIVKERFLYGYEENPLIHKLLGKNKWLWEQQDLYFTRLTNAIAQFNSYYGAVQVLNKLKKELKKEKTKEIETELISGCNKWQGEISMNQKMIQQTHGALQIFNFFSNLD